MAQCYICLEVIEAVRVPVKHCYRDANPCCVPVHQACHDEHVRVRGPKCFVCHKMHPVTTKWAVDHLRTLAEMMERPEPELEEARLPEKRRIIAQLLDTAARFEVMNKDTGPEEARSVMDAYNQVKQAILAFYDYP
jgi:hypothetical protein